MDEKTRNKIKKFIKQTLENEKILEDEFKGLEAYFKMLKIKTPSNHYTQYNNHMVDAIITSLLVYYENNPAEVVDIDNEATKVKLTERVADAIKVAKQTFAFMLSSFSETNDSQNTPRK